MSLGFSEIWAITGPEAGAEIGSNGIAVTIAIGQDAKVIAPQFLRTDAAAEFTGLSKSLLEKLRVSGGGPPFVKAGRRVLYDRADLERWLSDRKRSSTSQGDRG